MKPLDIKDYKVFFDFDNTISNIDVIDAFLEKFATNSSWIELEKKWQQGEIGSEDCLRGQLSICQLNQKELTNFLDLVKIDPVFGKLISFLRQNRIFYAVVSDSFEFFIKYILEKNNINDMPIYANKLDIISGKVSLSFSNKGTGCGKCANCKKEKLSLGPAKKTIYIGDGLSDMCVAKYCDIVFAKDKLLKFGKEQKYNWIEFKGMFDILNKLAKAPKITSKERVLVS